MFNVDHWLARAARATTLARQTRRLGEPLNQLIDREFREALSVTRWDLIPKGIRGSIDVACDVGANRGTWTKGVLRLASPKRLVAFEPNPEVFDVLQRELGSDPRVELIKKAVGAAPGETTFNVTRVSELASIRPLTARGRSIHGVEEQPLRVETVEIVTLDDVLRDVERVSLLKIDVQGYEREVFAGARQTLERVDCLVCEVMYERDYYERAASFPELLKLLEETTPLRLVTISTPSLTREGLGAWADAIFVNDTVLARLKSA